MSQAMSEVSLQPTEGWHCSHLYYRFDRAALKQLSENELAEGRHSFGEKLKSAKRPLIIVGAGAFAGAIVEIHALGDNPVKRRSDRVEPLCDCVDDSHRFFDAIPGRRKRLMFWEGDHDGWPAKAIEHSIAFINEHTGQSERPA